MTDKIKLFSPKSDDLEIKKVVKTLKSGFWSSGSGTGNVLEFEKKFKKYSNEQGTHASLEGNTPAETAGCVCSNPINLNSFKWQQHCGGLFQLPAAA